jgi:type I restriction enzyme, S subunit
MSSEGAMSEERGETSALVPPLRFPEFRDAAEWKRKQLDGLISTVTPPKKIPTTEYLPNGQFPIIDQGQSDIAGWIDDPDSLIKENEPLIIFGDHTCALKLVWSPFAQGADGIKILKGNGLVTTEFLYQHLCFRPVLPEEYKRHFSILRNKAIAYPEAKSGEQQKIADCLSSLDNLITAETQKLDALKTHKKGLMQQLFPREGETIPRLRFPEFREAGEWEEMPIGEMLDLLSGFPFDGQDIGEDASGVPLMRGINITEGFIRHNQDIDRFFCGSSAELEKYRLRSNDLVIGMDGSKVGKNSALVAGPDAGALLVQRVARLRSKCETTIRFVFQHINSNIFHAYVDRINTSGGIPHISLKQISDFKICFPGTSEQKQIADCLSSLDDLITAQSQKIDALKTHKKSLMQQLFPVLKGVRE